MMKVVLMMGALMCAAMMASAETFTSEADGNWRHADTWDLAGFPEEFDDAVITNNSIELTQDEHVLLLSIYAGVLDGDSHSFIADYAADVRSGGIIRDGSFNILTVNLFSGRVDDGVYDIGYFNLMGGTAESNTMDISTFNWSGGRVNDSTVNVIDGTFTYSGGSPRFLHDSPMKVTGNFTQSGSGLMRLDGVSSVITNHGVWNLTTDADPFSGTGSFVNQGTFKKSGGTGINDVNVPFSDHSGTVEMDSGSLHFNANYDDLVFSNTTFSAEPGTYAHFPGGATFRGTITGSGGGTLSLGQGPFSGVRCYFTNNCSLSMGSGIINWNFGSWNGDVTTHSLVDVRTDYARSLLGGRWIASCWVRHTTDRNLILNSSVLEIPAGSTYEMQADGNLITGSGSGYVDLAGALSKTVGGDVSTVSAPVYGDGAVLNVSTGMLSLTGNGQLNDLTVFLATNTTWRPGGVNSNVTVSGDGTVHFFNDVTASGLWSLTNADMSVYFSSDLDRVYVTPSLMIDGTNSSFRFAKGQIRDGIVTSRIPFEVTSSGGDRYLGNCQFYNESEVDFYRPDTYLSSSTWHNQSGATHRVHVDGRFFSGASSTYYNRGTLRKAAGSGDADTDARWIDTGGTLAVDSGTLALSAQNNRFAGTQIALASGTVFQMAGTLASNISVSADGPSTLRLAAGGGNQSGLYDLPTTGPVTVELTANDLTMTGTVSGAQASFEWSGGRIVDSRMTNTTPTRISGSGSAYINGSHVHLGGGTVHTNKRIALSSSALYNDAGATYQLLSDGELIDKSGSYGYFRNSGTLLKTGGTGTTEINAVFQNQGGVVGAERGLLRFESAVDLTGGGLQVALGGTNDFGRASSLDIVTAAGTLTAVLRDGYTPTINDSFVVLSGSSLSGAFSSNNLPVLDPGLTWNVAYSATALTLSVVDADDTDGDGLGDDWELRCFGDLTTTDGGGSNMDNDPHSDQQEFVADTHGNDSNDWFRVQVVSNDSPFTVYFDSSSNRLYTMLGCSNLVDGAWTNVPGAGPRDGVGGSDSMQDTNQPAQGPFYRLEVEVP